MELNVPLSAAVLAVPASVTISLTLMLRLFRQRPESITTTIRPFLIGAMGGPHRHAVTTPWTVIVDRGTSPLQVVNLTGVPVVATLIVTILRKCFLPTVAVWPR